MRVVGGAARSSCSSRSGCATSSRKVAGLGQVQRQIGFERAKARRFANLPRAQQQDVLAIVLEARLEKAFIHAGKIRCSYPRPRSSSARGAALDDRRHLRRARRRPRGAIRRAGPRSDAAVGRPSVSNRSLTRTRISIGSVAPAARPETERRAEVRTSGGICAKGRFYDVAAGAAEAADAASHRQ